ncbi:MAG TPA: hypothetical protein VGB03_06275, partial [Acidimicrobiales bacterium]
MGSSRGTKAAVAVAVVALVVGALLVVRARSEGGPQEAVDAYLERWTTGRWADLQPLLDEPEPELAQVNEAMTRDLRVLSRRFTRGPVRRDGGRATAA